MSARNPIKSMSGNMWRALLDLRKRVDSRGLTADRSTWAALARRDLTFCVGTDSISGKPRNVWSLTGLGSMVADAYAEGQEATA